MSNLISVIMSVKDASATLKDSIESVLNQSYKDFEFLILDDFSVDSSMEIIQRYKQSDSRIKVFENKKNLGLTKSLNKLVSKSCGNFIARQDSDDISLNTRFEKQVSTLLNSDYKFVVCRAKSLQSNELIPKFSYYLPDRLVANYKNPFIHGTLMINKKTLLHVNGYDENYYYSQDYELFRRLMSKKVRYKYIKEPLYVLNTINNISSLQHEEQKNYFNLARRKKY